MEERAGCAGLQGNEEVAVGVARGLVSLPPSGEDRHESIMAGDLDCSTGWGRVGRGPRDQSPAPGHSLGCRAWCTSFQVSERAPVSALLFSSLKTTFLSDRC